MEKPVIGITANLFIMEDGMFPGMYRDYVNHDYIDTVIKAGGIPMILPVMDKETECESLLDRVDGILLSGGYDIAPQFYGEEPGNYMGFSMESVDQFYMNIIKVGYRMEKPILGICKGMQAINVAFQGTLLQDVQEKGKVLKHMQSAPRKCSTHTVEIKPYSRLSRLLGKKIRVNSFHHQAIEVVSNYFSVVAQSGDGIVEAIEMKGNDYVVGVQWHPEMMISQGNTTMLPLITDFIEQCKRIDRQDKMGCVKRTKRFFVS